MTPKLKYIDNGFYEISETDAKKYAGQLPKPGYAKDIKIDGSMYRLQRTRIDNKDVWAVWQPISLRTKENKSMNRLEVLQRKIRDMIREEIDSGFLNLEALGDASNPKFNFERIRDLIDEYGILDIFVNGKMYYLDSNIFHETLSDKDSLFVTDEEGGEHEIRYDQIEFVDAKGKRITS